MTDAILARLDALEAEAVDALDDPDDSIRTVAALALEVGAEAHHYVQRGDVAVALALAAGLEAGLLWGVLRRRHHVRAAETIERANWMLEWWPDARRGRKSRTSNPDGPPMKGPPDDVLRAMMQQEIDRGARKRGVAAQRVREKLYKQEQIARADARANGVDKIPRELQAPSAGRILDRTIGVTARAKKKKP